MVSEIESMLVAPLLWVLGEAEYIDRGHGREELFLASRKEGKIGREKSTWGKILFPPACT